MTDIVAGRDRSRIPERGVLSKVPQVTVFFWIIKVLCTTVGETFSDFFNEKLGFGLRNTSIAAGILLGVVLVVQFKVKKYVPAIYWLTVVLISIFGTLLTDILTDNLKFPLEYSTIIFTGLLALTFAVWFAKEHTLSIHSIFTPRRETFYWLAILFTFALGTATGDLWGEKLGLGYLKTGLIVVGIIAAATMAWRLGLDAVLAFWIAYILTRPLGASLGDYLSQPRTNGGLGLGPTVTSAIFLAAILGVVAYLSVTHRDFIEDPMKPSATENKGRVVIWQVVAVVALLLGAGGTGYKLRSDQLRRQAVAAATASRPLGDLSSFKQRAEDMLVKVKAGNMDGASSGADDLETAWDNAQAVMQAMNGDKWTVMDNAIDKVLKNVRSSSSGSGAALDALLAVIASLDPPAGQAVVPIPAKDLGPPPDAAVADHTAPPSKPLGDLSPFKKLTQDILDKVHDGDMSGAKSAGTKLETAWDDAQDVMQPMNGAKWTVMDNAIDRVLKNLRSSKPSATDSGAALESLLGVIDSLDAPP